MCFTWRTASHCTHMCDRRPSHCMCAIQCHMCITTHSHERSPSATLHVCNTVPHVYCCTLMHGLLYHTRRIGQQQVPALVRGEDGTPIHHGVVERSYDKLRAIIQLYVLHKQEARTCVLHSPSTCIPCTASSVHMVHSPSMHQPSVCTSVQQHTTGCSLSCACTAQGN